ncbi:MAG: hypothetical protein M1834_005525 [Cirrosporium novae-zelandiae]|nr:MAG: hypothetical protein M1834_005525 [Cirrosporium novae-zelandiae]
MTRPEISPKILLATTESQWLFTDAELLRTPSILDGLTVEKERENRAKGVSFITQVGIRQHLPQMTLATASVFLHRFFMRYSMVDVGQRQGMHYYSVGATCLWLATKVEENCRKLSDVICDCVKVAQKNPDLTVDVQSKEYWKWRDTILRIEDTLLEALCFDLMVESPYAILYDLILKFGVSHNKTLRNAAWAFVNDSHLTTLCLQFSSRTIAASALYCATRFCGVQIPDDRDGRPWWRVADVKLLDMKKACNKMAAIYENAHSRSGEGNIYVSTPEDEDETTAKTRKRRTSNTPTPETRKRQRTESEEGEVAKEQGDKRQRSENGDRSPIVENGVKPSTAEKENSLHMNNKEKPHDEKPSETKLDEAKPDESEEGEEGEVVEDS